MFKVAISVLAMLWSISASARPADCLVEIGGAVKINGMCDFVPSPQGFQVLNVVGPLIIVDVSRNGDGSADAFWNEEPGTNHAHSSLGLLRQDGACWVGSGTRVCAWKLGERVANSRGGIELPKADVEADCSRQHGTSKIGYNSCLEASQSAYDDVKEVWANLPIAIRETCAGKATTRQPHYYVFIRACIIQEVEMAEVRDKAKGRRSFRY